MAAPVYIYIRVNSIVLVRNRHYIERSLTGIYIIDIIVKSKHIYSSFRAKIGIYTYILLY